MSIDNFRRYFDKIFDLSVILYCRKVVSFRSCPEASSKEYRKRDVSHNCGCTESQAGLPMILSNRPVNSNLPPRTRQNHSTIHKRCEAQLYRYVLWTDKIGTT